MPAAIAKEERAEKTRKERAERQQEQRDALEFYRKYKHFIEFVQRREITWGQNGKGTIYQYVIGFKDFNEG